MVASPTDILRAASPVPAPRTSADLSRKKRTPITADFQIWEVYLGPGAILARDIGNKHGEC